MGADSLLLAPALARPFLPLQRQLADYESGTNTSQQQELSIHQTLDNLTRSCNEMDLAANMEGARSAMWKQSETTPTANTNENACGRTRGAC